MPDTGPSQVTSVSERIYKALLVAYPKEFRRALRTAYGAGIRGPMPRSAAARWSLRACQVVGSHPARSGCDLVRREEQGDEVEVFDALGARPRAADSPRRFESWLGRHGYYCRGGIRELRDPGRSPSEESLAMGPGNRIVDPSVWCCVASELRILGGSRSGACGSLRGKADEVCSRCQSLRCRIFAGSEIMMTG